MTKTSSEKQGKPWNIPRIFATEIRHLLNHTKGSVLSSRKLIKKLGRFGVNYAMVKIWDNKFWRHTKAKMPWNQICQVRQSRKEWFFLSNHYVPGAPFPAMKINLILDGPLYTSAPLTLIKVSMMGESKSLSSLIITHKIHVRYTYIWLIVMANVGKHTLDSIGI